MEAPNLSVTCTGEAREGGLASLLSPYGVEPTSEGPLGQTHPLPPSERAELDEILGQKTRALEMRAGAPGKTLAAPGGLTSHRVLPFCSQEPVPRRVCVPRHNKNVRCLAPA